MILTFAITLKTEIQIKKAFRRTYGATSSLFKQHVLDKTKKSFPVFKSQVVTVGSKGLVNLQPQEHKKKHSKKSKHN